MQITDPGLNSGYSALSVVLGLVQIVLASHAASLQRGYLWTAGSRDETVPPLTGIAGRLERALRPSKRRRDPSSRMSSRSSPSPTRDLRAADPSRPSPYESHYHGSRPRGRRARAKMWC
jgi:hypothetical protein